MRPWAQRLVPVAGLLVCCAPLLVLTLRGWASGVLFFGALSSGLALWKAQLPAPQLGERERLYAMAMVAALVAPILAVALSALLRGDSYAGQFNAAGRSLLAVPIFLFALRARLDAARLLRYVLPLALALALGVLEIQGRDTHWPQGRDTTAAVDPLVFGYLSLAFGLMCLMSIERGQGRAGERWGLIARVAGVALGLYLSLRSGSRSGWAALPLVVGIWMYLQWGRGHRWATALAIAAACLAPLAAYLLLPTVQLRVQEAWQEAAQYSWTEVAPVTSIGLRITYLRIAADLFALHPWAGIGDTTRIDAAALPAFGYASREAVEAAFRSAFHNQIVTSAVRFGVGGALASAALLFVPLAICARQLRHAGGVSRMCAAMGLAYTLCIVVSSMSTEVVDLKAMASLYAVVVAILCGCALARHEVAAGVAVASPISHTLPAASRS